MNIDTPLNSRLPALRSLWHEAFGDTDEFLNTFFTTAFSANRCRCVTANDDVAAALYWFDCTHDDRRIAYIYAVATAKAYRGQGICHKLMDNTHQHLTGLGYEGAILVPGSKELFRLYEGMGYQTCSHIREFSCTAAAEDIQLRPIDTAEFAERRKKLLPKGGVLQENENLDFLQAQAKFYAGTDFLLAAREEEDSVCGVELLGDETAAPGIVRTLGYSKGKFRTPGEGSPFAMYYPLGNSKLPPPSYFGLAFD